MRRNVGSEKNTAYGGRTRSSASLASILPPAPAATAVPDTDDGLIQVTVDGVEVRVPKGTTIFAAAEQAGYTPPHFCFHRDLSVPANCRMCLCEIEGQDKLQTSCSITAADGMQVRFDAPRVTEAVQGVLEFEFKNHPLDCPVCDQVGECYLQRYYLELGKYDPQPIERVRKDKVKDLGPITLDAERCVLCSRCVRFGEEIAGTADFLVANRSDHAEIMTFADRPIETDYALNYTDICPVGALTSNDFRFRKRVYYLESARSICQGCSTGCNIHVEYAEGVVYRYRPRYNDDVNDSWMCDPGRRSSTDMADTQDRLAEPLVRDADGAHEAVSWDALIETVATALGNAQGVAAIASPQLSNEDLFALSEVVCEAGGGAIDFRITDDWSRFGELVDGVLIRRDANPNTRGALEIFGLADQGSRVPAIIEGAGTVGALIVCGTALEHVPGLAGAMQAAAWTCFVGPRAVDTASHADVVIPICVHVERDGTFTNHAGRVQRFRSGIEPYARSRPAWAVFAAVREALGGAPAPASAAEAFAAIGDTVAGFAGMTYDVVGDGGAWLRGCEQAEVPPVGVKSRAGVRAPNLA